MNKLILGLSLFISSAVAGATVKVEHNAFETKIPITVEVDGGLVEKFKIRHDVDFKFDTDVSKLSSNNFSPFVLMFVQYIPYELDAVKKKNWPKNILKYHISSGLPFSGTEQLNATQFRPGHYKVYFELLQNAEGSELHYEVVDKSNTISFDIGKKTTEDKK